MNPTMPASAVDSADPAMPSLGNGPHPRISSGLNTMSMPTLSSMNSNGVRESPDPRSPIASITDSIENGIAMKITRKYVSARP